MNTFVWNVTLSWNKTIDLDFSYVENISKSWDKVVFIFGETKLKTSEEITLFLKQKLWELKNFDISISSEDKVEILDDDYEEWVYELVSFEWEDVNFDEIKDRFEDFDGVISIREAEISKRFGNRTIKVDFVY
jgi:hypothetical protein